MDDFSTRNIVLLTIDLGITGLCLANSSLLKAPRSMLYNILPLRSRTIPG